MFFNFQFDWLVHPIYSVEGDYPKLMRETVDYNSIKREGRKNSRLPKFTEEEINEIRGNVLI